MTENQWQIDQKMLQISTVERHVVTPRDLGVRITEVLLGIVGVKSHVLCVFDQQRPVAGLLQQNLT